jgi:PAS domain S-box-containing protein
MFLYLIPYLISLGITSGVAFLAWRRRGVTGALSFAIATSGQGLWTLGYIFELLSPGLQAKIFWDNFQLLGGVIYLLGIFAFALQYTGRAPSNLRWLIVLLSVVPAVYISLAFTDSWHGWVFSQIRLIPGEPFAELTYNFTPLTWIAYLYSSGLQLTSLYILVSSFVYASGFYRRQVGLMALGALIPLLGTTLTILGVTLTFHRDTTPLTFAIGNLIIAWGLFRWRLFDIAPIGRETVIENMRDVLIILDSQDNVIDANPAAHALLGKDAAHLIGQPGVEAFSAWPDLMARYQGVEEACVEIATDEGDQQRFFELNISPLRDRSQRLRGRLILVHDITERVLTERELEQHRQKLKEMVVARTAELSLTNQRLRREIDERERTEKALRESEARYKLSTNAGKVGVWEWDVQTNRLHADLNLLGFTEGELEFTAENWTNIFPSQEAARLIQVFQELFENRKIEFEEETQIRDKTGDIVWVLLRGSIIRGADGQARSLIGTASDITESRTLAERLANLRRIDKAILAAKSPKEIAQVALSHLRQMVSCAYASVVLFDRQAQAANVLASQSDSDAPQPSETPIELEAQFFEPVNGLWRGEIQQVEDCSSQPEAWSLATELHGDVRSYASIPLKLQEAVVGALHLGKRQTGFFSPEDLEVASEVTEQLAIAIQHANLLAQVQHYAEELEERIQERTAQLEAANKELEAFSYSVSHDLRAPLRAIDGYSQALLEDYESVLDEMGKAYLQYVRQSSHQMSGLIDDLLRLSRIMRSNMNRTQVDMSAIATQIANELQEAQPERQVEFIIAPEMIVDADENLIRIVMQNLLNNAWKFTSRHPTALIEVGTVEQEDGAQAYFVSDDGAGFNMAYSNKLFAPFQRLHGVHEFEGTGIGLATVQRIIKRHSGRVWAEGAVEQGARFYFTL